MELTRRDALAALGAAGAVGVGAALAGTSPPRAADRAPPGAVLETLTAAAEVLYPSDVEGIREFVEAYAIGRISDRDTYRDGVAMAVADLNDVAHEWEGARLADLDPEVRDRLFRQLGLQSAEPNPEGTTAERLRYYVVNELLFAFYASPTGGRLVGIENPVGYPGGTKSYQQGPEAAESGTASAPAMEPEADPEAGDDGRGP